MPIEIGEDEPLDRGRLAREQVQPESLLELQAQIINPAYSFGELQRDLVLANLTTYEVSLVNSYIKLIRLLHILNAQYAEISDPSDSEPLKEVIDYYEGRLAGLIEASRAKGGFTARNIRTERVEQKIKTEEQQVKKAWMDRILRR